MLNRFLIFFVVCAFNGFSDAMSFLPDKGPAVPYESLFSSANALSVAFELSFNSNESMCLDQHQVLFEGKCYSLLSQGPCQDGFRLVLDKHAMLSRNTFIPVCRQKRCPSNYELVKEYGKCFHVSDISVISCSNYTYASTNVFGESECHCSRYTYKLQDNDEKCFPVFSPGVCAEGLVLVPCKGFANHGYASCQRDYCVEFTEEYNSSFVPVYMNSGEVKCYALNLFGPSPSDDYAVFIETLPQIYLLKSITAIPDDDRSFTGTLESTSVSDECVPKSNGECVNIVYQPIDPIPDLEMLN